MTTPRCDHCRFWAAIEHTNGRGECHRYAPKPFVGSYTDGSEFETYWPETLAGEWCGEFQLNTEESK